jgi:desampylase
MEMGMRVAISRSLADRLTSEAIAAPGREVCGLLFGTSGRIAAVQPCVNVAESPADSFELDPVTLLAAHKAMRAGGANLIGHYHSHPNGRAEPSVRDAAAAPPDGTLWLIVTTGEVALWRAGTSGRHGRFARVALDVD